MILIILLAFAFIAVYDAAGLIQEGSQKELVVYSILYGFALILVLLQYGGAEIPSPVKGIQLVLEALHLVYP